MQITIHPYTIPLVCPLTLAGEELVSRTGWLVALKGPDGRTGWGEIAPLPGTSDETELTRMAAWDGERVDAAVVTPSVRCGLDMAFYNLGDPDFMPDVLRQLPPPRAQQPVSALLIGTIEEMLKQEIVAAREGYRTIKIKVGRLDPADEVKLLHTINAHAADDVKFRLDANRAWTPDDADRYLSVLTEMNVEYVEEPFADSRTSLAWSRGTGVPVALDESLRHMDPDELDDYAGLRAVVLKPTLLGGFSNCAVWADRARAIGAYPVISAMLESGVGIVSMARFAASLCDEDTAAGLDTHRWLADDVLEPRPDMKGGLCTSDYWDWSRYRIRTD